MWNPTRTKNSRLQGSPARDEQALAKLAARVKYNPQEVARSKYIISLLFLVFMVISCSSLPSLH